MATILLEEVSELTTTDNKKMTFVKGNFIDPDFSLGVQPNSIAYLEQGSLPYSSNQTMDLSKHSDPTFLLEVEGKDPWEFYGSDHNSGLLWYGKKELLDDIQNKVENVYRQHVFKHSFDVLSEEGMPISISPIIRWDFNDGTSLIISYVDTQYQQMYEIEDINAKEVLSYMFGAAIDDRLAHEFIQPYVARLLKKIKVPSIEVDFDIDDLGSEDDYPIQVGSKDFTSKHNELLLSLSYHLLCSLLGLHEVKPEDLENDELEISEIDVFLAKQLEKNRLMNNLEKPTQDTSTRFTYEYDNSKKEYTISFKNKDGNWSVETEYGGIGKKMTHDIKISTPNLEEAQETYLMLMKERIAKGYDIDDPTPKALPKILKKP